MAGSVARSNISQVVKQLDPLKQILTDDLALIIKGIALSAFDYILEETPQWSGSMVASTRIMAGRIDYSYTAKGDSASLHKQFGGKSSIAGKTMVATFESEGAPHKKGDLPGQGAAIRANAGNLNTFTLGQEIFITNNVKHRRGKSYAMFVELNRNAKGSEFLRQDNTPSGMYKAAKEKFGNMGKLTQAERDKFKARGLKGI